MSKFTRLVYSPKAYAFIYSRKDGRIIDVSNDIVGGVVNRLVNQPSTASIRLRNDDYKYTGKFNPKFFPMDGITIWLQKIANRPIQQFTGFIDTVPYFQAYPGEIEITATCTMKQFLYTHFDPGIGFYDWLTTKGWTPQGGVGSDPTGFFNDEAISVQVGDATDTGSGDGGFGQLLHDFLVEIGGFDASALAIGDLPPELPTAMKAAYLTRVNATEQAAEYLGPFLGRLMTMSANHTADQVADIVQSQLSSSISPNASLDDVKALAKAIEDSNNRIKPNIEQIVLAAIAMSGFDKDHDETDEKSPVRGKGFFAEVVGAANAGPVAEKKQIGTSAKDQARRFCNKFAEIIKSRQQTTTPVSTGGGTPQDAQPLSDSRISEVAQVLAYGYGKDRFYSQIVEACRSETNISVTKQIVECLNANRSLDEVTTVDILNIAEVAEKSSAQAVQWTDLFQSTTDTAVVSEGMSVDGKFDNKKVKVEVGTSYSHVDKKPWSPIPYTGKTDAINVDGFPKIGGVPLKHSEVKYFVYSRSVYDGKKREIDAVFDDANIEVGQIVVVTNKKTKKSCHCVYMGATNLSEKTAPIAVSEEAIKIVGRGPVSFSFLETKIPAPIKDRTAYIKSLSEVLGDKADPANPLGEANINAKDAEIYEKYYQGSNQRLAEYFYIAANCGLHLLDHKPDSNNLILSSDDAKGASAAAMRFLMEIGVIDKKSTETDIKPLTVPQSYPKNITVTFNKGDKTTSLEFNLANRTVAKSEVTVNPSSHFRKSNVVVQVVSGPNFPAPVWNGEVVRLPDDLVNDPTDTGTGAGGGGGATITWADLARFNTASAFTTLTSFPFDIIGSTLLLGEKSLMNDVPIMEGVTQLCRGSMRNFMSLPNGMFCAFYPDYFGVFKRTPYLNIRDAEIVDFNIVLNDAPLVTHMYVNGNTIDPLKNNIDVIDQLFSVGVITIDDMFTGASKGMNFIHKPSAVTGTGGESEPSSRKDTNKDKDGNDTGDKTPENIDVEKAAAVGAQSYYQKLSPESLRFLEVYGTRPKVINEPLIRSPWFEFFMAYNEFTYNWSMHTATTVELTFMPEVMAGGIVRFPDHGINMYVEAVNHQWDYSSGFETTVMLTAPSTYPIKDANGNDVLPEDAVPGMAIFNKVG